VWMYHDLISDMLNPRLTTRGCINCSLTCYALACNDGGVVADDSVEMAENFSILHARAMMGSHPASRICHLI
jgi:hypothetical protein